ncbi:hypothetical protein L596_018790 [Steinernema carpocapsae]|uniref:adenylate cyclase n=1 Tax=Steinernema carpocapsae TaxID=34508 RepID=A0A4V6A255_STECR|nr:hypothetical protein L596_018790 [Steinernema carpocapsae]
MALDSSTNSTLVSTKSLRYALPLSVHPCKLLFQRNDCIRVQSDGILAITGIPNIRSDHARLASQFACDLRALLRSFCDSTTAELNIQVGIASGPVSAGIVGVTKWHYDIIGDAVDEAVALQENSFPG